MPDSPRAVAEQKFAHHTLSALIGISEYCEDSNPGLRLQSELPMDAACEGGGFELETMRTDGA